MLKMIIFDWDDVFTLGSHDGYIACYHKAAQAVGVEVDQAVEQSRIFSKWGRSERTELEELLQEYPDRVDAAHIAYKEALLSDTFTDHLTLLEGSVEFLQEMSQSYRLAVASGLNPVVMKERVFPKFQIPPVFAQIMTNFDLEDPSCGKPHPDMLLKIMEDQKMSPAHTIMIGDAAGDMQMGKAAGLRTVAVLTGLMTREAAQQAETDYILENVTELKTILGEL